METRKVVASTLSVVGAAVFIIALFVGWYVVSASASVAGTTIAATETFYLGQTISFSSTCSGSLCPSSTPQNTSTYSQRGFNDIGHIYSFVQILVLVGIVLGIIGGGLLFVVVKGRLESVATYLILGALLLAIFAPVGLVVVQPTALTNDDYYDNYSDGNTSQTSPETSFFGSCSGTACGPGGGQTSEVRTWGPGLGWYLALAAFGLFLVALLVGRTGSTRAVPSSMQPVSGQAPAVQASGPQLISCRACGRVYTIGQFLFCPNCGAKMG